MELSIQYRAIGIKGKATEKATTIFNAQMHQGEIKKTTEEIYQLARNEARLLYQSGKILFIPILFLRRQATLERIYITAFADIYTAYKEHYQSRHPAES